MVAGGFFSAASAAETAVPAEKACDVTSAQLVWGFKESFRAYISGSIANGDWQVGAPATYVTPAFTWPEGSGSYDPESATGSISFLGGVTFSGHDGLLNTTISDPTLVLDDSGAHLLLDVSGVSMSDAMAGDSENVQTVTQIRFVELDLTAAPLDVGEQTVTARAVPTAITAEGFAEFGNYEPGTMFDPITFTMTLDCAEPEQDVVATPTESVTPLIAADPTAAEDESWIGWVGGGAAAALLAAAAAVVLIRRRQKARL